MRIRCLVRLLDAGKVSPHFLGPNGRHYKNEFRGAFFKQLCARTAKYPRRLCASIDYLLNLGMSGYQEM